MTDLMPREQIEAERAQELLRAGMLAALSRAEKAERDLLAARERIERLERVVGAAREVRRQPWSGVALFDLGVQLGKLNELRGK